MDYRERVQPDVSGVAVRAFSEDRISVPDEERVTFTQGSGPNVMSRSPSICVLEEGFRNACGEALRN